MRKLFLIIATAVLLIATACSGNFIDPGAGAFGGGIGGLGGLGDLFGDSNGGDGSGGSPQTQTYTGMADGQLYTLKITENTARYTAQSGDDYELTAGEKTSRGEVLSGGSNLTLKPTNSSNTFTVTISGSNLTKMNGQITWTDLTVSAAPATLTIPSGGGGVGSLTLSGQVYTEDYDIEAIMNGGSMYKYTPYTDSINSLTSNAGGTGSISNGQLSFSVGAPPASSLEPFKLDTDSSGYDVYKDAKVTPSDAKGITLDFIGVDLDKVNMNTNSMSMTMEMVWYTYVDKTCTITASGGTIYEPQTGTNIPYPSLNITLNQGWNTLNMKMTASSSQTSAAQVSASYKLDRGDLTTCKWVINEGNDYDW